MNVKMRSRQRGVGMTEVLIALLLLAIAVLGFVALQVRASTTGNEAFFRTQAMAIAKDLGERARLNLGELATYTTAGNWAGAIGDIEACEAADCATAGLAAYDIANVRNSAATLLPNGQVAMRPCAGSLLSCIFVSWDDTTPTIGNAATDCVTAAGRYRNGATCIMLEAY